MKKVIVAGLGLSAGVWFARAALVPAQLRAMAISGVSGAQPARISLHWAYGPGVRPLSLIIDLVGPGQQRGSLTISGQITSGEIALATALSGPYQLNTTATYRIMGLVRKHIQSFKLHRR